MEEKPRLMTCEEIGRHFISEDGMCLFCYFKSEKRGVVLWQSE